MATPYGQNHEIGTVNSVRGLCSSHSTPYHILPLTSTNQNILTQTTPTQFLQPQAMALCSPQLQRFLLNKICSNYGCNKTPKKNVGLKNEEGRRSYSAIAIDGPGSLAGVGGIRWGSVQLKGAREEMEDDVVIVQSDGLDGFSFAAVFDGHAGFSSVEFLRFVKINDFLVLVFVVMFSLFLFSCLQEGLKEYESVSVFKALGKSSRFVSNYLLQHLDNKLIYEEEPKVNTQQEKFWIVYYSIL